MPYSGCYATGRTAVLRSHALPGHALLLLLLIFGCRNLLRLSPSCCMTVRGIQSPQNPPMIALTMPSRSHAQVTTRRPPTSAGARDKAAPQLTPGALSVWTSEWADAANHVDISRDAIKPAPTSLEKAYEHR